jgi:hypothetical protein
MQNQIIKPDLEGLTYRIKPKACFGRLPLMAGESEESYTQLFSNTLLGQELRDSVSELWANDVAITTIDISRYRRMKAQFLDHALSQAIAAHLTALLDSDRSDSLMSLRGKGDKEAIGTIEEKLREAGLSTESLMGKVFVDYIDEITKMDILIAAAERRRNEAFHELNRHEERLLRIDNRQSGGALKAKAY